MFTTSRQEISHKADSHNNNSLVAELKFVTGINITIKYTMK